MAWRALFDLGLPPPWRTGGVGYRALFIGVFAAATWWGMASFIASRSPLGMLLVLVFTIASTLLWDRFGPDPLPQLWRQTWSIALPCALWMLFAIWYLRARRIRPPGWLLPGGQSVFAAVAMAENTNAGLSRRAALERLLLGGTSVLRLLVQWLLVGGVLLVVLMLSGALGRAGRPKRGARGLRGADPVSGHRGRAVGGSRAPRAALWLPSGFSRAELFAYTERTCSSSRWAWQRCSPCSCWCCGTRSPGDQP